MTMAPVFQPLPFAKLSSGQSAGGAVLPGQSGHSAGEIPGAEIPKLGSRQTVSLHGCFSLIPDHKTKSCLKQVTVSPAKKGGFCDAL
tara:strand:- start:840 stop:1100 length:261 start_codon:yes stop_codon:yes gene_type:complete